MRVALAIPLLTFLTLISVISNIPLLRSIIVFVYVSFVPGFVLLKLLNLRKISVLTTILLSLGLSIASSMFLSFLVNEFYLCFGFGRPLSAFPLVVAVTSFSLIIYLLGFAKNRYFSDLKLSPKSRTYFILLLIGVLPVISISSALSINVSLMLLLYVVLAVLCVFSIMIKSFVSSKFIPFLIFSVSLSILLLNVFLSSRMIGDDANIEFYVFSLTQIDQHWGPLNASIDSYRALSYNAMLSITTLPDLYSVLMNIKGELVFKVLYPFIFAFVPLGLYAIYEKQMGKYIGLLSVFFFIFTSNAFFGELTSLNRQIVGELFLVLTVFVWLNTTIPVIKKRLLVIIFGVSIAISHYSLAYIFLSIVFAIFLISRIKPKFDQTFNTPVVLALFGLTFFWYSIISGELLSGLIKTIEVTWGQLSSGVIPSAAGSAASMVNLPQTFTAATWINIFLTATINFFLIIGVLYVTIGKTGASKQYIFLSFIAAILLAATLALPSVAAILNFTRFYAIALLFLSPCFAIGAKSFFELCSRGFYYIASFSKNKVYKKTNSAVIFFMISMLLVGYGLSQSGFVNYVTAGAIHSQTFDFNRMTQSNDPLIKMQFYTAYIPDSDALSSYWLLNNINSESVVYADSVSRDHVLASCALIPSKQMFYMSNRGFENNSFVYLGSLNVLNGVIANGTQYFNSSEIKPYLSNQIYCNGNSEIWQAISFG